MPIRAILTSKGSVRTTANEPLMPDPRRSAHRIQVTPATRLVSAQSTLRVVARLLTGLSNCIRQLSKVSLTLSTGRSVDFQRQGDFTHVQPLQVWHSYCLPIEQMTKQLQSDLSELDKLKGIRIAMTDDEEPLFIGLSYRQKGSDEKTFPWTFWMAMAVLYGVCALMMWWVGT